MSSTDPKNDQAPADAKAKEPKQGAKATRMRSAAHAANTSVQIGLLVVIFLVANFGAAKWFIKKDLSPNEQNTLSETTRNVIDQIDADTRIITAFSQNSPDFQRVVELTELYDDEAGTRVSSEVLDPVRNPTRSREISAKFNHEFTGNAVLIIQGDTMREIPEDELFHLERNRQGEWVRGAFGGEDAITSTLLELESEQRRVLYIITGKGPWPRTPKGSGADTLATLIAKRQGVEVRELSLTDITEIPADASAVVVANAKYDFNGAEIRMLHRFFEERKGGIITLLNPEASLPNYYAFLRLYGIDPVPQVAVTRASQLGGNDATIFEVPVDFVAGPELTDPFLNIDATFPGRSSHLIVDEANDELFRRKISVAKVAISKPEFWGESTPAATPATFDAATDTDGPLTLAAIVEKRSVEDKKLGVRSARMAVIANPHLLDPTTLTQENVDFLFSAISWSMGQSSMIGITPAQPSIFKLTLKEGSQGTLTWVICALMPAITLIIAYLVWQRRRA
ncbi:Gldg family protein [Sulfuriroseicoccus oceanibius]|uniref:Gldg family protein n=1 Tax=Sulfuriroseicoccus oceanibius TaxID=2707525 RepID=A0A6B3L0M8_9BACT|nr:Gldg family protein [Sulfuriroseicoccus oceanibius]QQL44372.1 Gldg family protein [Sulfuriroseicoccus oceanibius]